MSALQSCMGGWCQRRDSCGHFSAATEAQEPIERLCPRGADGASQKESADMTRIRFSTQARIEQIAAVLLPSGVTTAQIGAALQLSAAAWLSKVLTAAVNSGHAFRCTARVSESMKSPENVYFPTAESRDAFMAAYQVGQMAKRKAYWRERAFKRQGRDRTAEIAKRSAQRKERREQEEANAVAAALNRRSLSVAEAEQRKERARLDREAKAAKKSRAKAEAKKTQQRLKAQTRAAGALVFKSGTESPKPKKLAFSEMPALNPNNVQPKVIPCQLRDRFATTEAPSVVSSRECRRWAEVAAA